MEMEKERWNGNDNMLEYEKKLGVDVEVAVVDQRGESPSPVVAGCIQHPVSKMDTLAGIAIKYGVEVFLFLWINYSLFIYMLSFKIDWLIDSFQGFRHKKDEWFGYRSSNVCSQISSDSSTGKASSVSMFIQWPWVPSFLFLFHISGFSLTLQQLCSVLCNMIQTPLNLTHNSFYLHFLTQL